MGITRDLPVSSGSAFRTMARRWITGAAVFLVLAILAAPGLPSQAKTTALAANDNFPGTTVTTLPAQLTATTTDATTEAGEPTTVCSGTATIGKTVWYTLSVNTLTDLVISTIASDFDTVIAVYTGDALDGLTPVVCGDYPLPGRGDAVQASVSFMAAAGTSYRIQIGGKAGASGNLVADFIVRPRPSNDDFPGTSVTALPDKFTVDTTNATIQPGEPTSVCAPIHKTVWYTFTPTTTTLLTIHTGGSGFDTVLAVYTGDAVDRLTPVPDEIGRAHV